MTQHVCKLFSTRRFAQTVFGTWLVQAQQGGTLIYHRDLLALDHSIYSRAFTGHIGREMNRVNAQPCWEGVV